jgi:hypothetical protein
MEKQVSKNQEQSNPGSEFNAKVDEFGRIILTESEEELRARIDNLQNTETADSEE